MMKEKTDSEIFDACIRILLKSRCGEVTKHDLEREVVVTFARGNYDGLSTVVIEVNGSPIRGRAILMVTGSGIDEPESCDECLLNPPCLSIENRDQRLIKVRSDSPKILIFCRLANIAYRADKGRAIMRRIDCKVHFFENTCDSFNFANCDSVTVSQEET